MLFKVSYGRPEMCVACGAQERATPLVRRSVAFPFAFRVCGCCMRCERGNTVTPATPGFVRRGLLEKGRDHRACAKW
eukprot:2991779-Rhodomonas_salina.1